MRVCGKAIAFDGTRGAITGMMRGAAGLDVQEVGRMRKGLIAATVVAAVVAPPAGAGASPTARAAAGCRSVHQNQRKTATYSFVERLQKVTDYGSGNIHIT